MHAAICHALPKVLAVAAAVVYGALCAPLVTLLAIAVYSQYYTRVCHPVMQASWFGAFGRNALPRLAAADAADKCGDGD